MRRGGILSMRSLLRRQRTAGDGFKIFRGPRYAVLFISVCVRAWMCKTKPTAQAVGFDE
ncbi:hypothetical protein ALP32_101746 [Pseudomonas avellanae]|uniref:Uncharacterized protein n=1 Tax=Pseudomonas avellanae TaxID=46257 RepID=A0A3M5T6H9_9PSED|nr:hypothetical protein ALP32_101746 [Pseudomonas avellanae]